MSILHMRHNGQGEWYAAGVNYSRPKKSRHKLAWAAAALVIVGTGYSLVQSITSPAKQSAIQAPLGTFRNPIDLATDAQAQSIGAAKLLRQIYVNSDDQKVFVVNQNRLSILLNLYHGRVVTFPSGNNERTYKIEGVCLGKLPALNLRDEEGNSQGTAAESNVKPTEIKTGPMVPVKKAEISAANPCALD